MNTTALTVPDAEATSTIVIEGLIIALAVVFVVLRFYVRITTKAGLGWDDWLILAAVVATLITAIILLVGKYKLSRVLLEPRKDIVFSPSDTQLEIADPFFPTQQLASTPTARP